MQFNVNLSEVLNVGRGNPHNKYTINNEALICSEYRKKKNFGVNLALTLVWMNNTSRLEITQMGH